MTYDTKQTLDSNARKKYNPATVTQITCWRQYMIYVHISFWHMNADSTFGSAQDVFFSDIWQNIESAAYVKVTSCLSNQNTADIVSVLLL